MKRDCSQEQKDLARQHATGQRVNPMTPVLGRWSDWEDTYDTWLKYAVSHNNFGRGHSGGQALAMNFEAGEITTTLKFFFYTLCITYYVSPREILSCRKLKVATRYFECLRLKRYYKTISSSSAKKKKDHRSVNWSGPQTSAGDYITTEPNIIRTIWR